MKLRIYSLLFNAASGYVWLFANLLRLAQRAREAAWIACTNENLRTLNVRQTRHSRFN